jgi:hypothetical protein
LTISERRKALEIFRENPANNQEAYTKFSLKNVFPYEANLPVPLSFLIESTRNTDWKKSLITLCENNLPIDYIKTKYIAEGRKKETYIEKIKTLINNDDFDASIIQAIKNVNKMKIPAIVAGEDILNDEDEHEGDNPTLFVRLNSAGVQLSNEELIYSIYKATFPETKELVESIGLGFIAPSRIISLVSRLVQSDHNNGDYPHPIGVTEFRNRIKTAPKKFTNKLKELIGDNENKPAAILFESAIKILQLYDDINVPDVLVKNLINSTPDLFLMLLQWLYKNNNPSLSNGEKRKIFGAFSALCWFGHDNNRFVREIWENLKERDIWNKRILRKPFYHNNEFIMYPLVQPEVLREFLLKWVVLKGKTWNELYTMDGDSLSEQYKQILERKFEKEEARKEKIDGIWTIFIEKLIKNKSMLLFAQRDYVNKKFKDFNQIEDLEDTNIPWDWDHIYPNKYIFGLRYVDDNIRHWSGTIGNLRALALEDNRSLGDKSPAEKLKPKEEDAKERGLSIEELQKQWLNESFIENDWEYWENISDRIYDGDKKGIKNHLKAVINRLCNIYAEWYTTVYIGDLFNFGNK